MIALAPRRLAALAALFATACEPIRLQALVLPVLSDAGPSAPGFEAGTAEVDADAQPAAHGDRCRAGTYRGHMRGAYRSEPSGLCGVTAGAPEPLELDVAFALEHEGDQEFYTVRGGCMRVPGEERLSSPDDSAYGLTFELTGTVNCATGKAAFQLRGTYVSKSFCTLGVAWARYFTLGFIDGRFDPESGSFVDATWTLRERVAEAGGTGVFTASLDADAGVPPPRGESCLGGSFPGDLTPQPVPVPPTP